MALDITVDVKSPTPPYEQIRSQIAAYIGAGLLADGARLPTMRALAADLGVATGTVARAYSELEAAGLIASRRRTGTVVVGGARRTGPRRRTSCGARPSSSPSRPARRAWTARRCCRSSAPPLIRQGAAGSAQPGT